MDRQISESIVYKLVKNFFACQAEGNRSEIEKQLNSLRMQDPLEFVNHLLQILETSTEYEPKIFVTVLLRQCLCGFEKSFQRETYKRFKKDEKSSFYCRVYKMLFNQIDIKFQQKLAQLIGEISSWMVYDETKKWDQLKTNIVVLIQSKQTQLLVSGFIILEKLFKACSSNYWTDTNFFKQIFIHALAIDHGKLRLAILKSFSALIIAESKNEINKLKFLGKLFLQNFQKAFKQFKQHREQIITTFDEVLNNVPSFFTQIFDQLNGLLQYFYSKLGEDDDKIKQMVIQMYIDYYQNQSKLFIEREGYQKLIIRMIYGYMIEMEYDIGQDWLNPVELDQDQLGLNDYRQNLSLFERLVDPLNTQRVLRIISEEAKLLLIDKNDWRKSYVAIMSLSTIGKYFGNTKQLASIIEMLLVFIKDQNPKIRFAACYTLGVFSNQNNSLFYKLYGFQIAIGILSRFYDNVPRIRAQGAASISNLLEGLQFRIFSLYYQELMEMLLENLSCEKGIIKLYFLSAISSAIEFGRKDFSPYLDRLCRILFVNVLQLKDENKNKNTIIIGIETLTIAASVVGPKLFYRHLSRLIEIMMFVQKRELYNNNDDNSSIHILMSCWTRLSKLYPELIGKIAEKIIPQILLFTCKLRGQEDEQKIVNDLVMLSFQDNVPVKRYRKYIGVRDHDRQKTLRILHYLKEFIQKLNTNYIPFQEQTNHMLIQLIDPKYPQDIRIEASKVFIEILKIKINRQSREDSRQFGIRLINTFYSYFADLPKYDCQPFLLDTINAIIRIFPYKVFNQQEIRQFSQLLRIQIQKMLEAASQLKPSNQKTKGLYQDQEQEKQAIRRSHFKSQSICQSCIKIAQIYGGLLIKHKEEMLEIFLNFISQFATVFQLSFQQGIKPYRFFLTLISDAMYQYDYSILCQYWGQFSSHLEKVCESTIEEERDTAMVVLAMFADKTPVQYGLNENIQKKWLKIFRNCLSVPKIKMNSSKTIIQFILLTTGKILSLYCQVIQKQDLNCWLNNLNLLQHEIQRKEQYSFLTNILINRKDLLLDLNPEQKLNVSQILVSYDKQVQEEKNVSQCSKQTLTEIQQIMSLLEDGPGKRMMKKIVE